MIASPEKCLGGRDAPMACIVFKLAPKWYMETNGVVKLCTQALRPYASVSTCARLVDGWDTVNACVQGVGGNEIWGRR